MTKRKKHQWAISWWRPVGEFDKNGERRMLPARYKAKWYVSKKAAYKSRWMNDRVVITVPNIPFVYQRGQKPRKIIQIQVDYPEE